NATGFEIFSFTPRGAPSTSDTAVAPSALSTQPGSSVDAQSTALSACIYHSLLGHLPEYDRGIKRARFAVLRLTKVPAVLVEGGFLTEQGECKLIAQKEWRAKLAHAISVGIESYRALGMKKQPPLLVADYRKQIKSAPIAISFAAPDNNKEAIISKEKAAWQAFKDKKSDEFKKLLSPDLVAVYGPGISNLQKELDAMSKTEMKSFDLSDFNVVFPDPG